MFPKKESLFPGVHVIRALLLWVHIRAPVFWKLPYVCVLGLDYVQHHFEVYLR